MTTTLHCALINIFSLLSLLVSLQASVYIIHLISYMLCPVHIR